MQGKIMSPDTTPWVSFVFLQLYEQRARPFSLDSRFCNKPRIMVYLALRVSPDGCALKKRKAKNLLGTPRDTICLAMHFESASITWPLVIGGVWSCGSTSEVTHSFRLSQTSLDSPRYSLNLQGLCCFSPFPHRYFAGSDFVSRRRY